MSTVTETRRQRRWPFKLALIWLVAFNLRSTVLAIAPVLPFIRSDLHLSYGTSGGLAALPLLCTAAAAVPGALLANLLGARALIGTGLVGIGLGSLVRLTQPAAFQLFLGTFILSVSAAVILPAAASLIRDWFSETVERASAIYAFGIIVGSIVATSVTGFLLVFGGWRGTVAIWSFPPLIMALVWFVFAPRADARGDEPHGLRSLVRARGVWKSAGLFGAQSTVYLTSTAWIPFLFSDEGPHYVSVLLFVLGAASIPSVLLLSVNRFPFATSASFHVMTGMIMLGGALGFVLGLRQLGWLFAALVGIGSGLAFAATLALPPIMALRDNQVAAYSGLMYTGGYALAFTGPLLGGVLLDHTGRLTSPFLPAVAAALLTIALGSRLHA